MCMQCMMGAVTAGAGATGVRTWVAAKGFPWMTPRLMRVATVSLIVVGLIGASISFHGT